MLSIMLSIILIICSFYFWHQKNLGKESFNNIDNSSCPYSFKEIEKTHYPVYITTKNINTKETYQKFQSDTLFDDMIPQYKALRETSSLYLLDKRIHILELIIKANSVSSFRESLDITFKSFDNKPLLKASYNFNKKLYYLVDYTGNANEPSIKSWSGVLNNNVEQLGIRSRINDLGKWDDNLWIGDKCNKINNIDNFLDMVGFIEIICDTSSSFKPEVNTYLGFWDPMIPPKIHSVLTKDVNMLPDDVRPYASTAYRPKHSEKDYYSLGEYLYSTKFDNPALKNQFRDQESRIMVKKGDYVKTPKTMTWVWDNKGGKDNRAPRTVYRQDDFVEGANSFKCMGDYVTKVPSHNRAYKTINVDEKTHPHVCIRSDCLEIHNEGEYKYLYHDRDSGADSDGSAWSNYYPGSVTHLDSTNKIGYPGHYLMSFKSGHRNFGKDEINRRINIKAECLTPILPPKLDSKPIDSVINSNFTLEKSKYDRNKAIGLETIKGEINNARVSANQTLTDNLALVENKENRYVATTKHNAEMDNRKNQYISRTIFLNELKDKLTKTTENQDKISNISNKTSANVDAYNKKLESNKNMLQNVNQKLVEEANKTTKNIDYALSLQVFEARKPDNPAKLFT